MGKYTGIVIGDIHIGVLKPEIMYHEINHILFDKIRSMDKLDFVVIVGDYFDKKIYVSDPNAVLAVNVMQELIKLCEEKNSKLRVVYGTESHEANQYGIFEDINTSIDFKIVRHACEEELFPDLKILYLPEEFIYSKSEYYKEFFEKEEEYDYIFGHGVVNEVMTQVKIPKEKESKSKKVPIFRVGELFHMCKGQIYFGHYHINSNIDNKFFYTGSFTRWCFGEEVDKGYYVINANTDKGKYTNEFIKNTLAETYSTIGFSYARLADNDALNKSLDCANVILDKKLYDHVRFVFNIPEDAKEPEFMIERIRSTYKDMRNVKCEIVNGYIEKESKRKHAAIRENYERYKYLFDKSMDIPEKIRQFMIVEYNADIDIDTLNDLLYKDINDLIHAETNKDDN